jgi:glycosyltransferase involved in cell wall biosynthesis
MAEAGAAVHIVEMRRRPYAANNLRALVQLRALLRTVQPHVVHGHSSTGGALARVAALGSPAARVYTPNGIARSRVARTIERALARRTDRVVAVSESEGRLALALGIATREQLVVIPNGIDLDAPAPAIDLRSKLGVDAATPLVGTVARFVPQKAPEVFVQACARVARLQPDAHFVLIGSGPLHALVTGEIQRGAFGGRFYHVPFLENASSAFDQLDVFVLASRFEGGPYTPLEAMRAGTAVIVSDAVGNRDAVEAGVSGLVVPVDDPAALAEAIEHLLRDPDAREAMVESAHQRLHDRFDVRAMGAALSALYRELSSRRT